MSRKSARYTQLLENSIKANRDNVKLGRLYGLIQLFNKDINKVVACYSFEYIPGYENLDIDYLLSKLEAWTKDHPGYTLLFSRESTCINDLTCFMLEEGEYIAVETKPYSNVQSDYRTNSPNYAVLFIKHLVPRVDLAGILAPLYIVETTEADIRSCKEAYSRQANMQNNPFGR